VSGTYYIWLYTDGNGVTYNVSCERSAAAAITTPDSQNIPGIAMGNGTWPGVVDDDTDRNDVYSVNLVSGQEVIITCTAPGGIGVVLLAPGSSSIVSSSTYTSLRWSTGSTVVVKYTPAVSGTYYIWLYTDGNGVTYALTVDGAASTAPSTTTTAQPSTTTTTLPTGTTTTTTLPSGGGTQFTDVSSSPYRTAIESLASQSIIGGYSDGTFRPLNMVLRAQFAKMIVLSLGLPVTEGGTSMTFRDVEKPTSSLYPDDYIAVAALNNLIQGYAGGYFKPYTDLTRAQLLTIVVRAAQRYKASAMQEPPGYWDGILPAVDATHGKNIARAEYNGLLYGIELYSFSIYGKATRGEIAQIMWNLRQK
jgi:hypothetical protein